METLLIIIAVVAVLAFLVWYFLLRSPQEGGVFRLPLQLLGLKDIPAVPFSIEAVVETALGLAGRGKEASQALNGLQRIFTIDGRTANARAFLFGLDDNDDPQKAREMVMEEMATMRPSHLQLVDTLRQRLGRTSVMEKASDTGELTQLPLDRPDDFSISWTTWADVYADAKAHLPGFAKTLEVSAEGAEAATQAFWKHIAQYGQAFNLLLPQKLGVAEPGEPHAGRTIYRIDLRFFEEFASTETGGFTRFTPGVVVELYQDPESLNLLPYKIEVRGARGEESRTFVRSETTSGLWLYALQAAKTAVTVWGIWIGHVYHWHIVTGALQLTLYTTDGLDRRHSLRQLLDPMSKYLIGFDDFLLLAFEQIAPPTSFKTPLDLLELLNSFAHNRDYHDDDPRVTLKRLNIAAEDFTTAGGEPWDAFPFVRRLLALWDANEDYVRGYVELAWPDDDAVINDGPLRAWVRASSDPDGGNVRGLPALNGPDAKEELIQLLTSYLYRVTAHGSSRMNVAANPGLSFVANFPPCLQSSEFPSEAEAGETTDLLRFLPNTGTIGGMVMFLFTFVFSAPYESFIPIKGIDQDLFFPGGKDVPENVLLIAYRQTVEKVLRQTDPQSQQIHQWPRNVET